jgi:hypothetical protein
MQIDIIRGCTITGFFDGSVDDVEIFFNYTIFNDPDLILYRLPAEGQTLGRVYNIYDLSSPICMTQSSNPYKRVK